MGYNTQDEIVKIVNQLIKRCGTRNPYKVADELEIHILFEFYETAWSIQGNLEESIYLQNGLHPDMNKSYYGTESDTDIISSPRSSLGGGIKEFNIFDMRENRMEYEANVFAARLLYRTIRLLNILNRGMIFSKLLAVCTPT